MRTLSTIAILLGSLLTHAQNVNRVEYYFDADPGFGNGISIPITEAPDLTRDFNIPLNTTSEGFHLLYIRAKSSGLWSIPFAKAVFVQRNAQTSSVTFIDRLEYFFDADPGWGNGIEVPITTAADISQNFTIPLTAVGEGFHVLYYRARNAEGYWSIPLAKPVFVQRNAQTATTPNLKQIEFFIDTDPGLGNGTPLTVSGTSYDELSVFDISSVPTGFHVLYIRSQDENEQWSKVFSKPFFVELSGSNIETIEYYFDDGTTQTSVRIYNSFTPGKNLILDFAAVLEGLLPNTTYTMHLVAVNADGQRSTEVTHTFMTPAVICDPITAPAVVNATLCGSGSVTLTASGATATQDYQWYTSATEPAITGITGNSFTTPTLTNTTAYFVSIRNGTCESIRTSVTVTVNSLPTAPTVGSVSICGGSTATLIASGGTAGQYRWYTVATGGTALAGETNDTFTTPVLSASTDYFVAINNGTCESTRTSVTVTFNSLPTAPSAGPVSICGGSTATLIASGGTDGQYRWYTAATGGSPITGEVNSSFITPVLTTTTSYFVSINDGLCESNRTSVTATINPLPAIPIVTSSIAPVGNALTICSTTALTLTAPVGFASYNWSTGATTQQISVSTTGNYSVTVTDASACKSPPSDVLVVTVVLASCNNQPPVISTTSTSTTIGGVATINLIDLISDADNNIVLSSLAIIQQPPSGAAATITNGVLEINYQGVSFSGRDQVTIQVCDDFGECTQQVLEIEVIGDIEIFNGLSPGSDGRNDFFRIQNIELLKPENTVTIYNRWGSKVFEVEDYNNTTRVFRGLNDKGDELPSGTYFYKIAFERETINGYLTIKR